VRRWPAVELCSPAFTLTVYTHLLDGEHAPALDLSSELSAVRQVHATLGLLAA
jgi:hypothetical protein